MKLKLVSSISFTLLICMQIAYADDTAAQAGVSMSPDKMPTQEQIKRMQEAGVIPMDLSKVDPDEVKAALEKMGNTQTVSGPDQAPAAAPAPASPNPAPGVSVVQPGSAATTQAGAASTGDKSGTELQHTTDSPIDESAGSLKMKPSAVPPPPKASTPPVAPPSKPKPADTDMDESQGDADSSSDSSSNSSSQLSTTDSTFSDESDPNS